MQNPLFFAENSQQRFPQVSSEISSDSLDRQLIKAMDTADISKTMAIQFHEPLSHNDEEALVDVCQNGFYSAFHESKTIIGQF